MSNEIVIGVEEMAPGLGVRLRFMLHGNAGARAPVLQLPINKPTSELVEALEKLLAEVKDEPTPEPHRTGPFGGAKPKPAKSESKPKPAEKPKRRGRPPKSKD